MRLSLGGSPPSTPKNTFPSAGMTLLRGLPEWLSNLVRQDLTRPNPDFKMKDGLTAEERALVDDRIRIWQPHPEGTLVPRYYWRQELAAFGEIEVVRGDVGDFEHTLQFGPLPHQIETTNEFDRWDGDIGLRAPCGWGKALANGEPILTPEGEKPIGEARVGDQVAGTDGHFYSVTGVYPQGERELFRVTFTDGTHVDCDDEHLWTLQRRREKGQPAVTLRLADLRRRSLRGAAGRCYYLPEVRPVEFAPNRGAMPIAPYTLGILLGDGHIGTRGAVQFTTPDDEILTHMELPARHRFVPMHTRGKNTGSAESYRISMNRSDAHQREHASIWELLEGLGLAGHLSHTKFIPSAYKFASVEDRLEMLRGLFDTDGHAGASFRVEYATVSQQLADDVQWLVSSLGGTCTVAARKTRYTNKDGTKSKWFDSFRLHAKLPRHLNPFRLSRKGESYANVQRQREPTRAIEKIEPIGVGPATCISVASPDRLFLTRNCVPTHNTAASFYRMAQWRGRALVIVPNNNKMAEWRKEACKFLGLEPRQIGTIQGSKRDWLDKPVTVAMAKTLALQEFSPEEQGAFATTTLDEGHLMQATVISKCLGKFGGRRLVLTATPGKGVRRELTELHFGARWLAPQAERMPTRVEFLPVPVWEKLQRADWQWLRTMVGRDINYARVGGKVCRQLMDQGRRVLVLGNQIDPLAQIYRDLGEAGGFVCGQESVKVLAGQFGTVRAALEARTETSWPRRCDGYMDDVKQHANPILGTGVTATQPAGTGMDVSSLDGGVILLPIAKRDTCVQVLGRFQRVHPDKQSPLIVVLVPDTRAGRDAAKAMAAHLSAGGAEVVFHAAVGRM